MTFKEIIFHERKKLNNMILDFNEHSEITEYLYEIYININKLNYEQHYHLMNECLRMAYAMNKLWTLENNFNLNYMLSDDYDKYNLNLFIYETFFGIINFLKIYCENSFIDVNRGEILQFIYGINNIIWREKIEKENNEIDFDFIKINKNLITDVIILPALDSNKKYDKIIFKISKDGILECEFIDNITEDVYILNNYFGKLEPKYQLLSQNIKEIKDDLLQKRKEEFYETEIKENL